MHIAENMKIVLTYEHYESGLHKAHITDAENSLSCRQHLSEIANTVNMQKTLSFSYSKSHIAQLSPHIVKAY